MIRVYFKTDTPGVNGLKGEWKYAGSDDPMGNKDLIFVLSSETVQYEIPKDSILYVERSDQ